MLDDLKSTDNVVLPPSSSKFWAKWLAAWESNRRASKSRSLKRRQRRPLPPPKSKILAVRRSAAHAPVRISNFDCSGKIATSRTTIVGTVAASVRLAMWAMGPRVGEGQNAQITRLGGQIS